MSPGRVGARKVMLTTVPAGGAGESSHSVRERKKVCRAIGPWAIVPPNSEAAAASSSTWIGL